MGDSKAIPVPVVVDFTGIAYDPATNRWSVPSNAPAFSLKGRQGRGVGKTTVTPGNNTIIWTVNPTGYASGLVPSLPSGAVSFDPKDNPKWPFDQPMAVPNEPMTYSVADNFPAGANVTYGYTIAVRLTSATTPSASIDFEHDPEVENQGSNVGPS